MFYLYTFAPDTKVWETDFFTISSGGFRTVVGFMHALVTKFIVVLLTAIWFFTSRNWWKYSVLVPFSMFLFQFIGILNYQMQYIDEYDFYYSLVVVAPVVAVMIIISRKLDQNTQLLDVREQVEQEIERIKKERLG